MYRVSVWFHLRVVTWLISHSKLVGEKEILIACSTVRGWILSISINNIDHEFCIDISFVRSKIYCFFNNTLLFKGMLIITILTSQRFNEKVSVWQYSVQIEKMKIMRFIFASIQDSSFRNELEVYVLCATESNLSFCGTVDGSTGTFSKGEHKEVWCQINDAINPLCGNIILATWHFVYFVFWSIF